jgi:hypothetical protein
MGGARRLIIGEISQSDIKGEALVKKLGEMDSEAATEGGSGENESNEPKE